MIIKQKVYYTYTKNMFLGQLIIVAMFIYVCTVNYNYYLHN